MNCDKCVHSGVCKDEETSRNAETKIQSVVNETAIAESPFGVKALIYCKNFKMKWQKKTKTEAH